MKKEDKKIVIIHEEMMGTEESAKFLRLTKRVVEDKLRSGEIPGYKKNKNWYCFRSELMEYVKGNSK
jgi:hypothetical protein